MYPRHTFSDTIERVEKLTHSRRMHVRLCISRRSAFHDLIAFDTKVALGVWHDEVRGISRHQAPPGESIDIDEIDSDEEEGRAENSGSRQTSEPPTRPPSSASERASDPDDDFHMGGVTGAKSTDAQGGGDEFDFEVEMWDDTPFTGGTTSTSTKPTNQPKRSGNPPPPSFNQDEDQDMWDIVDEIQTQVKPNETTLPLGNPPPPVDDDDDWDSMYA